MFSKCTLKTAGREMGCCVVTGATGLLGSAFLRNSRAASYVAHSRMNEIYTASPVTWVHSELAEEHSVGHLLETHRPAVVFHLAAITDVDWCEDNPEAAMAVNAHATRRIARACRQFGCTMVYMSTDSVFDGREGNYTEGDIPVPINTYALSKAEGERATREETDDHVIVRSNLFGWNALPKVSLAEWVLNLLSQGKAVPGFTDAIFAPLLADTLSNLMMEIVASPFRGTVHAASRPAISKFEFAKALARAFGHSDKGIQPKKAESAKFRGARPLNTSLDPSHIEELLSRKMPSISDEIERFCELSHVSPRGSKCGVRC